MSRSTFAIPGAIALLVLAGLVTALTGDGWRDVMGWLGLSLPVFAVAAAALRHSPRKDHQ